MSVLWRLISRPGEEHFCLVLVPSPPRGDMFDIMQKSKLFVLVESVLAVKTDLKKPHNSVSILVFL